MPRRHGCLLNSLVVCIDQVTYPDMQVALFGFISFGQDGVKGDVLSNFDMSFISQLFRFGMCCSGACVWGLGSRDCHMTTM